MKDVIAELRNHPVAVAVEPIRQHAIESAAQWAQGYIDRAVKEFEAAGWDLRTVCPSPYGQMSRAAYQAAAIKRERYGKLVRWTVTSVRHGDPIPVELNAEGCAKFIEEAKEDASFAYDAFIAKLCAKVGAVLSAKIEGSHVWGYSILTVEVREFDVVKVQRWKTQQITNVSKLGKYFPQWPTRLQK